MRNRAQPRGAPEIARDPQAALRAGPHERGRVHPVGVDLEGDDIRRDPVGIDPGPADAREADGEGLRVAVIVDETLAHLLERDQRGGGDDARLPHGAAEELADSASLRDGLGAAAKHRPDRRGEALREAELHRVGRCAKVARVHSERSGRVEDARAVEVHSQAAPVRQLGDRFCLLRRDNRAAAVVMGVLEAHERGAREHADRPDRGIDVLERGAAVPVRHRARLQRAEDEGCPHLVLVDVSEIAEDHLVAALGLRQHAAEIPEHAARDVERRFLPDALGRALLEPVHRGVLAVLVVADLGLGHGPAHRRRRQRERIAAQLDDLQSPNASFALATATTSNGDTMIAGRKSATFTSRMLRSLRPTPMMSNPPTAFISAR